jgi:D-alanine transaminase
MDAIRLDNPHSVDEWIAVTNELLAHHPGDQAVYIQVTRGVPPKRDHVMPKGITPTVFMMSNPLSSPSKEQIDNGVACVTARDFRWERATQVTSLAACSRARSGGRRRRGPSCSATAC